MEDEKKTRRANHEGTEIKQDKNGYWYWSCAYKDENGDNQTFFRKRKVKSDVVALKREFLADRAKQKKIITNKDKMKFEEFANNWVEKYKKPPFCKQSTYDNYKFTLKKHINPFFGKYYINDIKAETIQDFIYKLSNEDNLSSGSVKKTVSQVRVILNKALELNKIAVFPVGVVIPKAINKKMEILSNKHLEAIDRYKTLYTRIWKFCLATGIRRSECLGLRWSNVDFINRILYIKEQLIKTKKDGEYFDTTKTENSERMFHITDAMFTLLEEQKKWQDKNSSKFENFNENDLVFTTFKGTAFYPSAVSQSWKKFQIKYKIPVLGFHSFRHTFISNLVESGVDIATVMSLSGHTELSTLQIYLHPSDDARKKALEKQSINIFN